MCHGGRRSPHPSHPDIRPPMNAAGDEVVHADGRVELADTSALESSPLYNEDLAPIPIARRTWTTYNYAALWISMIAGHWLCGYRPARAGGRAVPRRHETQHRAADPGGPAGADVRLRVPGCDSQRTSLLVRRIHMTNRRDFGKMALGGTLGALLAAPRSGRATVHPSAPGIKLCA